MMRFKTMKSICIIFILYTCFLCSCRNSSNTTKQPVFKDESQFEDTLIKANKFLLERDKELIESYVSRRNWNMKITESGLWYEIYKHTGSKPVKPGDIVKYNYVLSLLDGTVCYSSENAEPGEIKIGQSGKEFGLDEGMLKMRKGEKAHFILPPYMAHGLIGDMEKIPARSVIVYDIEILEIIDF
jgi:FKBP-type peptidyl-prolyl cis-trans isomerase FkpA